MARLCPWNSRLEKEKLISYLQRTPQRFDAIVLMGCNGPSLMELSRRTVKLVASKLRSGGALMIYEQPNYGFGRSADPAVLQNWSRLAEAVDIYNPTRIRKAQHLLARYFESPRPGVYYPRAAWLRRV